MVDRIDTKILHQTRFAELMNLPWKEFAKEVGHAKAALICRRIGIEQEGRCACCGNYEWLGKELPMELEHKNGDHHDNRRENIELLCPNCHALTPTWRGRNKKRPRLAVSDEELLAALKREPSIRKALISCGMAGKGNNYQRCYKLLNMGP